MVHKPPASELDRDEIRRYGRHLTLPEVGIEGQKRLKMARVLLVGAGGLGSPLGLYLAAAGVGTLGLVDDDRVEVSNLQRQVLYGQSDRGRPKVEAAVDRLRDVNPHVELRPHALRLDACNVLDLIADYDVVVDGSDNFPTRYLISDACGIAGKPDVWGAIERFEGQVSVFWAARGACYRCLFPEPPPPGEIPSCAEAGVLGVLPGIVGCLQANEVLKLILGVGEPLVGRFLIFDALKLRFRELRLEKNPECPFCGVAPAERRLAEYGTACADLESGRSTSQSSEMTSNDADLPLEIGVHQLASWQKEGRGVVLLDVREPQEYRICHLPGSRLVPLRQLPERLEELDPEELMVVYCHHGPRSLHAVRFLRQNGFPRTTNLAGGIDAWSLGIDPSVPRY